MEKQIEAYLHEHIPISQAMGIQVEHASLQKVILFAPFANNINHKKTVFGGSLHAVATLACWGWLHVRLQELFHEDIQIVIANSTVAYLAPVFSDFHAECTMADLSNWERFIKAFHKK